jgi:N-acetylmuramoyl-L-alanine amidase
VHPSGVVLEFAGFDRIGEHTQGHNSGSIGICFIGNMQTTKPTIEALVAAARTVNLGKLGQHIALDMPVSAIRPHQAVKPTACPGAHLLQPWINGRSGIDWIRWFVATGA